MSEEELEHIIMLTACVKDILNALNRKVLDDEDCEEIRGHLKVIYDGLCIKQESLRKHKA